MAIVDVQVEFFETHWEQVHHITNIQVKDPVVLIFDTQYSFHVVLQLHIANFVLLKSSLALFLALIDIVVS